MKGESVGEGGTLGRDVPGWQEARVIHVDGYVGDVRGVIASPPSLRRAGEVQGNEMIEIQDAGRGGRGLRKARRFTKIKAISVSS